MAALKVLETNIIHASDVIYWVDGSTASNEEVMERLTCPVAVQLTARPSDLQMQQGSGKTAFWHKFGGSIVHGPADDEDKAFPPAAPYPLAGSVADPKGRYNPRLFSITAGTAAGHRIVLYPSPLGARFSKAGGLKSTLRWNDTQTAVPWAMLIMEVEIALETSMLFRCQADHRGDFMLSVKGLPPLPEGIDHYDAQLSLSAPAAGSSNTPMDPADLTAAALGSLDSEGTFEDSLSLQIVFGEIRLLQTLNKKFLTVQPS